MFNFSGQALASLWDKVGLVCSVKWNEHCIYFVRLTILDRPLLISLRAHCCHMGTAIKHPVPDRVNWSFVIFDIWALWCICFFWGGRQTTWWKWHWFVLLREGEGSRPYVNHPTCPRRQEKSESGRPCPSKKCRIESDCFGRNRRCVCDGVCGMSCVRRCEWISSLLSSTWLHYLIMSDAFCCILVRMISVVILWFVALTRRYICIQGRIYGALRLPPPHLQPTLNFMMILPFY